MSRKLRLTQQMQGFLSQAWQVRLKTVLLRLDNADQVFQENDSNPNYAPETDLTGLGRKLTTLLLFY